jgi:hypothetical protein
MGWSTPGITLRDVCHFVKKDRIEIGWIKREPSGVEVNGPSPPSAYVARHFSDTAKFARAKPLFENDIELSGQFARFSR